MPDDTTTVRLSKALLWRLKEYAAQHHLKVQEAVEKLLNDAMISSNKKK